MNELSTPHVRVMPELGPHRPQGPDVLEKLAQAAPARRAAPPDPKSRLAIVVKVFAALGNKGEEHPG